MPRGGQVLGDFCHSKKSLAPGACRIRHRSLSMRIVSPGSMRQRFPADVVKNKKKTGSMTIL